jgi:hypothetical protein
LQPFIIEFDSPSLTSADTVISGNIDDSTMDIARSINRLFLIDLIPCYEPFARQCHHIFLKPLPRLHVTEGYHRIIRSICGH